MSRRVRAAHVVPLATFALLCVLLGTSLRRSPQGAAAPEPIVGRSAPDFALARLHEPGALLQGSDLLGQVWILNAWASWCGPCREELPALHALAKAGRAPLYGLAFKDAPQDSRDWLARNGNPYVQTLVDTQGRTGEAFGVQGVPATFVIDRDGTVQLRHDGALTPQVLRTRIEPLLQALDAPAAQARAWSALARRWMSQGQLDRAVDALRHASAAQPEDARLLCDLAGVLAARNGNRLEGEPAALVERALRVDPDHVQALSLAGAHALERGDDALAQQHWMRALARLDANAPAAAMLRENLARLRGRTAAPAQAAATTAGSPPAR